MTVLRAGFLFIAMQMICIAMFGSSASLNAAPFNPKRLLQKTSLHVDQMQFQDVVKLLSEQEKMEITLDPSVIKEFTPNDKITLHVDGITLNSILDILCNGFSSQVFYEVDDEGRVTYFTPDIANRHMLEVSYPLVGLGSLTEDLDVFAAAIHFGVDGQWSDESGDSGDGAIVSIDRTMMTVKQSQTVHRQIAELLMKMAASASGRPRTPTVIDQTELRIWKALQKVSPPPKGEVTLDEFLEQVFVPLKISYWIDKNNLDSERIMPDVKFNLAGKRRPVQEMLNMILQPQKLSFVVEDEVVKIMTEAFCLERTTVEVYNVRQLITPASSPSQIAEKLQMTPDTGLWYGVQEHGSGQILDVGTFLIVKQTSNAHRAISALLYGN